jgi:hypothetical protein
MQECKNNEDKMKIADFKTGDIILFHTPLVWYKPMSWLSALIRLFTKSYYNHVGVVVCNWGVPFLNEAIEIGVTPIMLSERINGSDIRVIRPKSPIMDEKTFAMQANSKLGRTGYDFKGLLFYQLIYQLTGHWLGHTDAGHADRRMYCAEYGAWMYKNIFKDWWEVAPNVIDQSVAFFTVFKGIFYSSE